MQNLHDPTFGGQYQVSYPIQLGHECSAKVIQAGKKVNHLHPGDLVVLEAGIPCGRCKNCLSGKYNLCENILFLSAAPYAKGALCRYMAYPAKFTYKLPTFLDPSHGALIEPLCVALHAVKRAKTPLKTVLVMGADCLGLMTIACCKMMGATEIIVCDRYENKLQKAIDMGATVVINAAKLPLENAVKNLTRGHGADVVFHTIDSRNALSTSVHLVAKSGQIVITSNIYAKVEFDFSLLKSKEADIITAYRYRDVFPEAIQAVTSQRIKLSDMITYHFPFEKTQQAFLCARNEMPDVLRICIDFDEVVT